MLILFPKMPVFIGSNDETVALKNIKTIKDYDELNVNRREILVVYEIQL